MMIGSTHDQAGELALALEWGLIDLDEVVAWADRRILDGADVDQALFEVSLSESPKVALSGLNRLAPACSFWPSVLRVLGRITEIEELSPKQASKLAKHIFHLGMRRDAPEPFSNLMHHWDYIDLAIQGVTGSPENAVGEFVQDVAALLDKHVE